MLKQEAGVNVPNGPQDASYRVFQVHGVVPVKLLNQLVKGAGEAVSIEGNVATLCFHQTSRSQLHPLDRAALTDVVLSLPPLCLTGLNFTYHRPPPGRIIAYPMHPRCLKGCDNGAGGWEDDR